RARSQRRRDPLLVGAVGDDRTKARWVARPLVDQQSERVGGSPSRSALPGQQLHLAVQRLGAHDQRHLRGRQLILGPRVPALGGRLHELVERALEPVLTEARRQFADQLDMAGRIVRVGDEHPDRIVATSLRGEARAQACPLDRGYQGALILSLRIRATRPACRSEWLSSISTRVSRTSPRNCCCLATTFSRWEPPRSRRATTSTYSSRPGTECRSPRCPRTTSSALRSPGRT